MVFHRSTFCLPGTETDHNSNTIQDHSLIRKGRAYDFMEYNLIRVKQGFNTWLFSFVDLRIDLHIKTVFSDKNGSSSDQVQSHSDPVMLTRPSWQRHRAL